MAKQAKKSEAKNATTKQQANGPHWSIGVFRNDKGKLVTVYVRADGTPVPYETRRVGGRKILHFGTYSGMPYREARQQLLKDAEAAGLASQEPQDADAIPEDFPGAKALAAAGIRTYAVLEAVEDLTSISGVGNKTAEAIREALEAR